MDRGIKTAIGTTLGLTALLVGCIDLLQEPASPPPTVLGLTFVLSSDRSTDASQTSAAAFAAADPASALIHAATGLTRAADGAENESAPDFAPTDGQRAPLALFDDVDEVRVQILREEDVVQDTTVALAPSEEETRIRIELDLRESRETLSVRVELLVGGLAAFRGDALVSVEAGDSAEVQIEPEPLAAGVSIPDSELELEDVGESAELGGQVLSVTGDPIPDLSLSWETLDPEVVEVTTDGLVTALAPGEARVVGSHGEFSDTVNVRVGRRAHTVMVEPDSVTLHEGQSQQFSATLLDSRGEPIPERPIAWASSDTGVATIDENGLATALKVGETAITATSQESEGQASVTVVQQPIERVDVRPDSAEIVEGETVQLTATPHNAAGEPLPGCRVAWESSDPDVATVDNTGLVTGIGTGEATIRATSEGVSGQADVIVAPIAVASVVVEPSADTLEVGSRQQFTATPLDGDGNPLDGRPVTWSSSDDDVATVGSDGLVRALTPGQTNIRATSEGVRGEAHLTVVPRPVDQVVVEPPSTTIEVGEDQQLTATPLASDGNPLPGRKVTWASSHPRIATVNSNGLVTGVAHGEATITAASEGAQGKATVTVRRAAIAEITIDPRAAEILVGGTVQFTATPRDAGGQPLPDRLVAWTSSATRIAGVSPTGLVTGRALGSTVIRASSEGASADVEVTVRRGRISGIVRSDDTGEPLEGATVELFIGLSEPLRRTTDSSGHYIFRDLAPGNYLMRASAPYHNPRDARMFLPTGEDATVDFRLDAIIVQGRVPREDP